ncbi:flagellar brake protein [Deltaproteobacteria bacterium OttesenSCG-928-M10]|nr:flagellar brake protein [Deltaproteobacteria bacterium OttesenSCG-928-M10]
MSESAPKGLSPDILICGTSIRLLALETTKSKWSTVFIGSRPGRYLIVEMPKVAGAPVKLDDNTRWSANFISKGAVYSFNTEVIGYTYRLVPLLFLEYPQEVEVANLRTEKRYPVHIPIISEVLEGSEELSAKGLLKALVVDISEGGFMMACPVALEPDTVIETTFYLPKKEPMAGIKAVVRACRGKPGGYFIGLAYSQSNSPEVWSRLKDLIISIENMPLRL